MSNEIKTSDDKDVFCQCIELEHRLPPPPEMGDKIKRWYCNIEISSFKMASVFQ